MYWSAIDNNQCDPVVWQCVYWPVLYVDVKSNRKDVFCQRTQWWRTKDTKRLKPIREQEVADSILLTNTADERNKPTYLSLVLGLQKNCDVNRCKLRNYKFDISLVSIFRLIQHCDPSCSVQSHRFPFYRWTTVSLSTKITFVQTPVVWSGQTWPLNKL